MLRFNYKQSLDTITDKLAKVR